MGSEMCIRDRPYTFRPSHVQSAELRRGLLQTKWPDRHATLHGQSQVTYLWVNASENTTWLQVENGKSSDAISYALTNDFSVLAAAHPTHITFDPIHVDAVGGCTMRTLLKKGHSRTWSEGTHCRRDAYQDPAARPWLDAGTAAPSGRIVAGATCPPKSVSISQLRHGVNVCKSAR